MMNFSKSKVKRLSLTFSQKKQICEYRLQNPKKKHSEVVDFFTEKFNLKTKLSKSTLSDIFASKENYLFQNDFNNDRKRLKRGQFPELEDALNEWFLAKLKNDEYISDQMIVDKCKDLSSSHNITDFKYSHGWLMRFKARYNINKLRQRVELNKFTAIHEFDQQLQSKTNEPIVESDEIIDTDEFIADVENNEPSVEFVDYTIKDSEPYFSSIEARNALIILKRFFNQQHHFDNDAMILLDRVEERINQYEISCTGDTSFELPVAQN